VLEAGQEDLADDVGVELVRQADAMVFMDDVCGQLLRPSEQRMGWRLDGLEDRSGAGCLR